MPARKLVLLVVALIIAGGTVILAKSMMTGPINQAASNASLAPSVDEILVAARDLPMGTLLKDTDLKWQAWPVSTESSSFAVKGKSNIADYVGAVVRQSLRVGEPIMPGRVVRSHEQGFMAAVLDPGMRAMSVPVTPAGGVAGFVFPGDHVDVIVTHQLSRKSDFEPNPHRVSETVLANVRVLALDQRTNDQTAEPKIAQTATLEVTSKQAETLALVTQIGSISLVLRSLANVPVPAEAGASTLESTGTPQVSSEALQPPALGQQDANESGMTWDSDVSHVLSKPANRQGAVQRIQIMRGKESTESVFELRQ